MQRNKQINPTFDEFFTTFYLPYAKTRKRSWQIDERLSRTWISPTFGHRKIKEIKPCEVQLWLTDLRQSGLAPSSCNRVFAVLRAAFSYAETTGHLRRGASPCATAKAFRVLPKRERFLSVEEGRVLMEALAESDRIEAKVLRLLMLTGARKSEILKAKWEYVDLERGILTVPLSKSGKVRYIHLSEEAISIFRNIERNEASPWVFPGRNPQNSLSDIYLFWNCLRQKLGLQDVRIHDLRHTFASYLVSTGRSLYEVQQLLGHSDPRMTARYAHFAKDTLKGAVECVADIMTKNRKWEERDIGESEYAKCERFRSLLKNTILDALLDLEKRLEKSSQDMKMSA